MQEQKRELKDKNGKLVAALADINEEHLVLNLRKLFEKSQTYKLCKDCQQPTNPKKMPSLEEGICFTCYGNKTSPSAQLLNALCARWTR